MLRPAHLNKYKLKSRNLERNHKTRKKKRKKKRDLANPETKIVVNTGI